MGLFSKDVKSGREVANRQREARLRDQAAGKTNPVTTADVKARHQTGSGSRIFSSLFK
jgi:hypothetical protein